MNINLWRMRNYLKSNSYLFEILVIVIFIFAAIIINLQMIRYGLTGLGAVRSVSYTHLRAHETS